ncbi:MAG: RagB/SusD family nutrient uptake outer membrane protein [Bacteroidales bacterium]|nr:RagB/SusD family nutrient uptake outer membrane protein [Bacteroidales bacterium]
MKKILNIVTVCASVMFTASCIGLDTPPYDRETDLTYWSEDPASAVAALNTCYTRLTSMSEMLNMEGASDNAYMKGLNETQPIGNGSFSTDNGYVKAIWDGYYAGIRICNELLTNIDKVPALDESLKARYIAECMTIRAYFYYELYTKFGDIPYTEKVLTVAESETIERTPKADVVTNIINDLETAISSNALPASYTAGDRGRITAGAAKAILAKVHLFEGNFDQVKTLTQDIMDSKTYSLFNDYAGLFRIENEYNSEIILDVQYTPAFREHNMMYYFLPPSMGGYSNLAPVQELVDSYIMLNGKGINEAGSGYDANNPYSNRDPRLAATVMYTGNSYTMADGTETVIDCNTGRDAYGTTSDVTPTGFYLKKWWDKSYRLTLQSGLNPILIRYADILLMNAEAYVETTGMTETVWNNTIRLIRQRAGFTEDSALNYNASADMKELVRNERRCELAFEGSRYKDIIRWRIAENVLNGNVHGFYTGAAVGTDNGFVILEKRNFDAQKHYLWPIPQKDRDINKNLTQNPNW